MGRIDLRPLIPADLEAAVGVWERARWEAQPWLEERMGYSHGDNLRHFREVVVPRNDVWLAVERNRVVGFLAVAAGHIDQLYVDPEFQRQGVGTALLAKAQSLFPELTLFTHQRNEKARAFYEGHGFRAVKFGTSPSPESEPDVKYVSGARPSVPRDDAR